MEASSSFTPAARSAMSWVSCAIWAVRSSISVVSALTSSVFLSLVCLFVVSSVSHQPLCSVSAVASSISWTMRSLMSFFTFPKGSAATRCETCESSRLPLRRARSARKEAMRSWRGSCCAVCSCARAVPPRARAWRREGRYFSPAPATDELEMISIAFSSVWISSARSACRLLKSSAFWPHSAVAPSRYFRSSSRPLVVDAKSPWSSASDCCVWARSVDFFETSCSAFSVLSFSCCMIISYACFALSSSAMSSDLLLPNSSFSFSSISTTPPDWNSYA
mmetsp:Transcript_21985/g.60078  ORF Transcript_21985/g.60078 Transcript_21985/m.60078 type:complete len:278 (-) Transcript_21985:708-1541(-)